jgi:AbrB family looped-hinge helix DNA binding protein
MATKITDDGQITIPKPVLEHLGIGPGSEVSFRKAADGSIVLEKAEATASTAAGPSWRVGRHCWPRAFY